MNYLTEDEVMNIQNTVRLLSIDDIDDVSQYLFNANIEEYNDFLNIAKLQNNFRVLTKGHPRGCLFVVEELYVT